MDEEWIELVDTLADGVKKAASFAKEKGMSDGIINGLETALQGMEELKPLIQKKVHFKRIRADLKDLVGELLESSKKGDENGCANKVDVEIRDCQVLSGELVEG